MIAALAFLRSPIGKYAAIALAAVLALLGIHHAGYRAGVDHQRAEYQKATERAEKRVVEVGKKSDAATEKVAEKHVQTVEKIRWRTQTLTKEVAVYVPQTVDREFRLSVGFVRVHDAAATGAALPESPGGSVETPSDVAPSQLAATFIGNYGTCYTWQSEALTWRSWYVTQRDLYNQATGLSPDGSRVSCIFCK